MYGCIKASPPCPPSSRLLNLVKLGIQQELLNNPTAVSNDEENSAQESSLKKASLPNNDIEIDVVGNCLIKKIRFVN